MQEEYIQIGRLGKPFGLHGAIKVLMWDEFNGLVPPKNVLFVQQGGDLIPYFFVSFKEQGAHLLVNFEDFDNPNTAHKVAKKGIFVRKEDIPIEFLEEEKSPVEELLGFNLVDKSLGIIGAIIDFDIMPFQTMVLVDFQDRKVMIPWVEAYILGFDMKKKIINVDLPEGLLDLQ